MEHAALDISFSFWRTHPLVPPSWPAHWVRPLGPLIGPDGTNHWSTYKSHWCANNTRWDDRESYFSCSETALKLLWYCHETENSPTETLCIWNCSEIALQLLRSCSESSNFVGVVVVAGILSALKLLWNCSGTALSAGILFLSFDSPLFCWDFSWRFAAALKLLWKYCGQWNHWGFSTGIPFFRFNCSETALKVLWVLLRILCYCSFFFSNDVSETARISLGNHSESASSVVLEDSLLPFFSTL